MRFTWDVFLSHASEDKDSVAKPLRDLLVARGLTVWLDDEQLTVGDSLRTQIERGIANSRFGLVVLSPSFLSKRNWTAKELNALFALDRPDHKKVLPVWHELDATLVERHAPMLADRLAVSTALGLDRVASEIVRAVRGGYRVNRLASPLRTTSAPRYRASVHPPT